MTTRNLTTRGAAFGLLVVMAAAIPALTGGDCLATEARLLPWTPSDGEASPADTLALGPLPVCGVAAADVPGDAGGVIRVTWEQPNGAAVADGAAVDGEASRVSPDSLEIFRYATGEEPESVGTVGATETEFLDRSAVDGVDYQYFVRSISDAGLADSEPSGAAAASAHWFARSLRFILVAAGLVVLAMAFLLVRKARSVR